MSNLEEMWCLPRETTGLSPRVLLCFPSTGSKVCVHVQPFPSLSISGPLLITVGHI